MTRLDREQASEDHQKAKPAEALKPWRDSEAVTKAYYVENHPTARLYYKTHKDGEPAIVATENKIQGAQGDAQTIRSIVDIAHARGWKEIEIGGSKQHAQELWIEAKARGITARGYEATDRDNQDATRREAQRFFRQAPDAATSRSQGRKQDQSEAQSLWENREGGKERTRNR